MNILFCAALSLGLCAACLAGEPASKESPQFSATLELNAGHERYRNPVVLLDDVAIIPVGPGGMRRASPYVGALLGLDGDIALGAEWDWTGSLNLEIRRSPDLPDLDRDHLRLLTGPVLSLSERGGEIELLMLVDETTLGGDFHRRGLGVRIGRMLRDGADLSRTTLDWTRYRHGRLDDLFDGDRLSLRHGVERMFEGNWRPLVRGRGGVVAETNRWGFGDLSYREIQLELEAGISPTSGWSLSASLGLRATWFLEPAPGLDFKRHDRRRGLTLAVGYETGKDARLRCEIEAVRRQSNDPVAEAELRRVGFALEWRF